MLIRDGWRVQSMWSRTHAVSVCVWGGQGGGQERELGTYALFYPNFPHVDFLHVHAGIFILVFEW